MRPAEPAGGEDADAGTGGEQRRGGDRGRAGTVQRGGDGQVPDGQLRYIRGLRDCAERIRAQADGGCPVDHGDGGRRHSAVAQQRFQLGRDLPVTGTRQAVGDQCRLQRDHRLPRAQRCPDLVGNREPSHRPTLSRRGAISRRAWSRSGEKIVYRHRA